MESRKPIYEYDSTGQATSKVAYLSKEDITNFNHKIGEKGIIIKEGALDEAVNAPQRKVFSHDAAQSLSEKAFAMALPIAQTHPFLEGNKRTATLAISHFLKMNNKAVELGAENQELQKLINQLADENPIKRYDFSYAISKLINEDVSLDKDDLDDATNEVVETSLKFETTEKTPDKILDSSTGLVFNSLGISSSAILSNNNQTFSLDSFKPLDKPVLLIDDTEATFESLFGESDPNSYTAIKLSPSNKK